MSAVFAVVFSFLILMSGLQSQAQSSSGNLTSNQTLNQNIAAARSLFERITGVIILPTDLRLQQMAGLLTAGDRLGAAAIATEEPNFYKVTVKNFAAVMSNRAETVLSPLNDFQATIIGAVRDELDARTLLTGNYAYKFQNLARREYDNSGYEQYSPEVNSSVDLKASLLKQEPQHSADFPFAGLLTTRAWAQAHYDAGTNRRAVEYTFREFLCTPISQWKDANLLDLNVRRDIDRKPGGDPRTYQKQCRTCHAPMDGMAGAFARLDFVNNVFVFTGPDRVADKYNQKPIYPHTATYDDSWVNRATQHHNVSFGWKNVSDGVITGTGVNDFGNMIANSEGFKSCMVKRVFRSMCHRDPLSSEQDLVLELSKEFSDKHYNLKKLFQKVALLPQCGLPTKAKQSTTGVKNFSQFFESMRIATGNLPVRRETLEFYKSALNRLPKDGRVDELSAPTMLTYTSLAGYFCTDNAQRVVGSVSDPGSIVEKQALEFWGRNPTKLESEKLKSLWSGENDNSLRFAKKVCTTIATSVAFLSN